MILEDDVNDLQTLLSGVNEKSQTLGLKTNINKNKFMTYLGYMINERWDPDKEKRCRIEQARTIFLKHRNFPTNKNSNFRLRS
nr:unnamed protein product [Callosobruchus chinensis]